MANLYGGPKIEANISNFFFSDIPGLESKMKIGGSAGGFIGLRMSEHFAIQEDILVHYKVSGLEQNRIKGDFEYLGAELTFYAVGSCITVVTFPSVQVLLQVMASVQNIK